MITEAIRNAEFADLPRIVEIYNSSIPGRLATSDLEPVTVESRVEWFASHKADRYPLWVFEKDGLILGWIGLRAFYGRPAYHATAETAVYVAPEAHGQGIAKLLLTQMQNRVSQFGIRTLLAFIFGHNEPSLRLFEGAGFVKWGEFPNVAELDGVKRDLRILGWQI
jgi:L-amino acid N-acyltransferase YncA